MQDDRARMTARVCVKTAMTMVVVWVLASSAAFGAKNLLENGDLAIPVKPTLEKTKKVQVEKTKEDPAEKVIHSRVPPGWSVEGPAAILPSKGPGVTITSESGTSPFIYQRIESKRRYRRAQMSFSVMAKTDAVDAVALEFSNRGGMDVRGKPHPGDGQWHKIELTVRLPDSDGVIEFRVRSYEGATFEVKNAALVTGTVAAGAPVGDFIEVGKQVTPVMVIGVAVLMLAVVMFFRTRRARLHTRLFESAILIAAAANIMLLLGRPLMLGIIANISWGLLAVASVVFIAARNRDLLIRELSKPGVLYLACIGAGFVYLVASIKHGSVRSADAAAKALYAFLIIETVVILGRRWLAAKRRRKEDSERVVRMGAGMVQADRGSSSGAVMPTRSATVEPGTHADNEPA